MIEHRMHPPTGHPDLAPQCPTAVILVIPGQAPLHFLEDLRPAPADAVQAWTADRRGTFEVQLQDADELRAVLEAITRRRVDRRITETYALCHRIDGLVGDIKAAPPMPRGAPWSRAGQRNELARRTAQSRAAKGRR